MPPTPELLPSAVAAPACAHRGRWALGLFLLVSALAVSAPKLLPVGGSPPHPSPDMSAVTALIEKGEREVRSDPEASKRDAQDALRLLANRPDADLAVRAHLLLCDYESERDMKAAQQEVAAATSLLPQVRRTALRAGVLLCKGGILETAGESSKAVERYREALALATQLNDEPMIAEGSYQLGYILGVRGDYANALTHLRQAEKLFQKLDRPLHQLAALNSIAILYNRIGEYAQARHMYTRALQAQSTPAQQRDQAATLNNLGRADENLHDWVAAREAYTRCLEISTQLAYPRGQGYALRGLAAVANATGDPQGALSTLERATAVMQQTPDARLHALLQLERGIALHHLTRLTESTAALVEAARIFGQADARGELAATFSELAAVYADSRNWRAAYDTQKKARSLSEALLRNQIDLRFAALKVEFDTAAKEKENIALKRENEVSAQALARGHAVRQLQLVVIVLMVLVALLAAVLALLQRRVTRRLQVLAMTDELTGVPNRRAVLTRLETLLATSEAPASILILDIDHFKSINDHHGHPAGDEVLKRMAQRLAAAVTPPSYFGRLGGEEFLIVLPATELAAARKVADRLRELVAATELIWEGRHITASIGVATGVPRADTPSTLLRRADNALYAAKHGGRNCVMTDPPEVGQKRLA